MLVLTRRPRQSVVFPTLGISVQIVRVAGQIVRLGVEAPRTIPVLRAEIGGPADAAGPAEAAPGALDPKVRHRLRGRLNTASMALYLAQQQLARGLTAAAGGTLDQALAELAGIEGELAPAEHRPQPPAPRRVRALLVEDNPNESTLLGSYLRLNGVDVAQAGDGQEALDYLASHDRPDAVLLDMSLPRRNGPSVVTAVRSDPSYSGLKVYAVTGARPEDVGLPTGPGGVDGWFTKPLNPARLVEALVAG